MEEQPQQQPTEFFIMTNRWKWSGNEDVVAVFWSRKEVDDWFNIHHFGDIHEAYNIRKYKRTEEGTLEFLKDWYQIE
jgi:hypothetical protein